MRPKSMSGEDPHLPKGCCLRIDTLDKAELVGCCKPYCKGSRGSAAKNKPLETSKAWCSLEDVVCYEHLLGHLKALAAFCLEKDD